MSQSVSINKKTLILDLLLFFKYYNRTVSCYQIRQPTFGIIYGHRVWSILPSSGQLRLVIVVVKKVNYCVFLLV